MQSYQSECEIYWQISPALPPKGYMVTAVTVTFAGHKSHGDLRSFFVRIILQFRNMLLLLHSLTRKRHTMPRQARQFSGTGIRQSILCRHTPACKTDGCLFRSNTKNVANEKWSPRTVPVIFSASGRGIQTHTRWQSRRPRSRGWC